MSNESSLDLSKWWGEFEFAEGTSRRWRIGPLTVWVSRLAREWQVAYERTHELDNRVEVVDVAAADDEPPAGLERSRYLLEKGSTLLVGPRLADRPVVARPGMPVVVPGGLSATLFVSSPVWVELEAGDPPQRFFEAPSRRQSSTWYGEDNLEGALYYAERTRARLERQGEVLPAHVTTAVTVNNVERQPIRIERIALPVPSMSVFSDEQGGLWTEHVVVDYLAGEDAPVRIERTPLAVIGKTTLVSRPRQPSDGNVIMRALSAALRVVS